MLDRYFGNVCELDLIFNFHKAYYVLDELLIAGKYVGLKLLAHPCGQHTGTACGSGQLYLWSTSGFVLWLDVCVMSTGELQEPSKRAVARAIADQDQLVESAKNGIEEQPQVGYVGRY